MGAARGYQRVLKAGRGASPEAMQKAVECMSNDAAQWLAPPKAIEIIPSLKFRSLGFRYRRLANPDLPDTIK